MSARERRTAERKANRLKKEAALLRIAELNASERNAKDTSCGNDSSSNPSEHDSPEGISGKRLKLNNGRPFASSDKPQNGTSFIQVPQADVRELRTLVRKRLNVLRKTPLLSLIKPTGFQADLNTQFSERVPIFFQDIQHLVLLSLLGQNTPFFPRWCHVEKWDNVSAVLVLFIEGVGINDYLQDQVSLPALSSSNFPFRLEVVMPTSSNGNLIEEFCSVPTVSFSQNQTDDLASYMKSLKESADSSKDILRLLQAVFSLNERPISFGDNENAQTVPKAEEIDVEGPSRSPRSQPLPQTDKFSRTSLLLSGWDMFENGYPVPVNETIFEKYRDFVSTKPCYKEVTNSSPMYGLDCEMCITSSGKKECTRVSIVNESLETVLDTLVLPDNNITNYLTKFSGITPVMMETVTTRLADVQNFIRQKLEPDAILVGHSLNFDLIALKMMHPYCIDTSFIFNLTGDRRKKSKLRHLAQCFLNKSIQIGPEGHCSIEDSSISMQLVQLKLSEGIEFGDKTLVKKFCAERKSHDVHVQYYGELENRSSYVNSLFTYASSRGKHSLIVSSSEVLEKYMDYVDPFIAKSLQTDESDPSLPEAKERGSCDEFVTCIASPSDQSLAKIVASKTPDNFLTVGHIILSKNQSCGPSSVKIDDLDRVNSLVSEVQQAVPQNGLFIALLCGSKTSSNGICLINLNNMT